MPARDDLAVSVLGQILTATDVCYFVRLVRRDIRRVEHEHLKPQTVQRFQAIRARHPHTPDRYVERLASLRNLLLRLEALHLALTGRPVETGPAAV